MSSTVTVEGMVDGPSWTDASCVTAAVRDLAVVDPHRVAVVGQDGVLGYGELWRRATGARAVAG